MKSAFSVTFLQVDWKTVISADKILKSPRINGSVDEGLYDLVRLGFIGFLFLLIFISK